MVHLREIAVKCEETGCDKVANVEVVEEWEVLGRYCIEHGKGKLKELQIKEQNESDEELADIGEAGAGEQTE